MKMKDTKQIRDEEDGGKTKMENNSINYKKEIIFRSHLSSLKKMFKQKG